MPDPNLKLRIETSADVSGAKEAEKALEKVHEEAKKSGETAEKLGIPSPLPGADDAAKKVHNIGVEAEETKKKLDAISADSVDAAAARLEAKLNKTEADLDAYEKAHTPVGAPPPLPDSPSDIAGKATAAAAGVGVLLAMAGAARVLLENLASGTKAAAEMAASLEGMDVAARDAALQGLGPLGDLIAQNSPLLVQYASDTEKIRKKFDDLWKAAGTQLAPALTEVSGALAGIDAVNFGADLGGAAAGAVAVVSDLKDGISGVADDLGLTDRLLGQLAISSVQLVTIWDFLKQKGKEFNDALASDPEQQMRAANAAAQSRAVILQQLARQLGQVQKEAALAALEPEERLLEIRGRQAAALERLKTTAMSQQAQSAAAQEFIALEQQALATERIVEAREKSILAVREEATLNRDLRAAQIAGDTERVKAIDEQLHYLDILKKVKDETLAKTLAERDAELDKAEAAKKAADEAAAAEKKAKEEAEAAEKKANAERMKGLREQITLIRERGQTELAELDAAGAKESAKQQARIATSEQIRAIELQIAQIQGNASQEEALQTEEKKQEQIRLTELREKEAAAAEKQLTTERAITAERNAQAAGRPSAPLQSSPLGPSGLNSPVNLLEATQPRDLSKELTPIGKPQTPPATTPQTPSPAPAAPQQPAGTPAQSSEASDPVATLQSALDAALTKLEACNEVAAQLKEAIPAGLDKIAATLGEIPAAVEAAGAAAVDKGSEIISAIAVLRAQIANLRT